MYISLDESLQRLEDCYNNRENILSDKDIENIAVAIRSYQAELAIQDREIELLNEKCDIYQRMVELSQNTYMNLKG